MKTPNIALLQSKMGYAFNDEQYLLTALSHSSYTNETKTRGVDVCSNERLEFLGDSVLSFITSEYIHAEFAHKSEGELSKLRATAVKDTSLCEYAQQLGLGEHLLLGRGEDNAAGRARMSTLENAFEALIAAIYLDGGIELARKFVLPFVSEKIKLVVSGVETHDHKTALQHLVQQHKDMVLEYILLDESGPDHDKVFTVAAQLNGQTIGTGSGSSKRAAEQMAAKMGMRNFGDGKCKS